MSANQTRRQVSLRISVTDRCQLRCVYCMPFSGVPKLPRTKVLTFEEIVRFVRTMQAEFDLKKVRITGGEPLVRSGIVDLVGALADLRVPDLALTTNGQLLSGLAAALKRAGLRRVNVNLASLNPETYRMITRGGDLERALVGITAALRAGLAPVKINVVVLRGLNDGEVTELANFGLALGCRVRFLELMPIGCARAEFHERFVSSAEVRGKLDEMFRLVPIGANGRGLALRSPAQPDVGGSSRDFFAVDSRGLSGVIGLISSESEPFCSGCTRLRLTSTGELIACLARNESVGIRELLSSDSPEARRALQALVVRQIAGKCSRTTFATTRAMASVGG